MSYIDLRDILKLEESEDEEEQETYQAWKEAIARTGWTTLEDLARNEPILIPEDEFENYAEELAEDIGLIQRDANWPYTHIDWGAAADELKQDYSTVSVEGITYYFQSY